MTPPAFTAPLFPAIPLPTISAAPRPLLTTTACAAAVPSPTPYTPSRVSRRTVLHATALAVSTALFPSVCRAANSARTSMSGDYKLDAAQVLTDMRLATELTRGAEGMSETVGRTRKEMNDFVALYRRNDKVSGSTSFSTLYTAINTLSGHYASYGSSYPVPEKRKKRLNQQYAEIDRALSRGR